MTTDTDILVSDLNQEMTPLGLRITEVYREFHVWRGDHCIYKLYVGQSRTSESELLAWLAGYQAAFSKFVKLGERG